VSQEQRLSVVAALTALASSHDYRDRADAGHALSSFADAPGTRTMLLELVLDDRDTFVTVATTEALLRRKDPVGLAIVAEALAASDFQHNSRIQAAVLEVFGIYASDRDAAARMCESLATDRSEQVRSGAGSLLRMLDEINPVLHPIQNG
jgi:hypothetical protein